MSQVVLRRFEVHAVAVEPLDPVVRALRTAEKERRLTSLALELTPRPPSLRVRLRGEAEMVASVMEGVQGKDVLILRDLVVPALVEPAEGFPVPPDAPPGRLYPDPLPLLRIDAVRGPAPEALAPSRQETRPVRVAIVDSGVKLDHVDLRQHLWPEFIGATEGDDVIDEDGHGTMLAGTILATANFGLEGFTPALQLIPVKFFDAATRPRGENAARAIDFAVAQGADIIELSWELGTDSSEVNKAIDAACEAGKLIVFAAGNHANDIDKLPALPSHHAKHWREQTITVMATDYYDEPAWFSNYGAASVDLAAPGVGIISTRPYRSKRAETPAGQSLRRCQFSGTSAASAHVAGAAALLLARYPGLEAKDLKECLVDSVEKRPGLRCASGGRLHLRRALRLAQAAATRKAASSRVT